MHVPEFLYWVASSDSTSAIVIGFAVLYGIPLALALLGLRYGSVLLGYLGVFMLICSVCTLMAVAADTRNPYTRALAASPGQILEVASINAALPGMRTAVASATADGALTNGEARDILGDPRVETERAAIRARALESAKRSISLR
jgi:hypothetical protein